MTFTSEKHQQQQKILFVTSSAIIIPDVVHIVSFITLAVKNSIISLVCILFLLAKLKTLKLFYLVEFVGSYLAPVLMFH